MSAIGRRGALGLLGLSAASAVAGPTACHDDVDEDGLAWNELPPLPPNRVDWSPHVPVAQPYWRQLGLAGMLAGTHGDGLIAAGGANFPEPGKTSNRDTVLGKVYWDEVFILQRTRDGGYAWRDGTWRLPMSIAYSATVSTPRGVLVVGGEGFRGGPNGTKKATLELFPHVFFLRFDPARAELVTEALPDLPRGVSYAVAGIVAETVYVAEGGDFWSLDLANPSSGWQTLPRWPGDPRSVAVGVAQGGRFFLLSGRGTSSGSWQFYRDVYAYDPRQGTWTREMDLPWCITAGLAFAVGQGSILAVGGDKDIDRWNLIQRQTALMNQYPPGSPERAAHNDVITWMYDHHTGDNVEILRYDLASRTWHEIGHFPGAPPVTTAAVHWGNDLVIVSGEVRPGVRTPRVWMARPIDTNP